MADYVQFTLPNKLPQNSGRGVRFALLTPTERDQSLLSAATLAGADKAKLQILRQREGVMRMLRAVTKKKGLSDSDVLKLPESEWMTARTVLGFVCALWSWTLPLAVYGWPR